MILVPIWFALVLMCIGVALGAVPYIFWLLMMYGVFSYLKRLAKSIKPDEAHTEKKSARVRFREYINSG